MTTLFAQYIVAQPLFFFATIVFLQEITLRRTVAAVCRTY